MNIKKINIWLTVASNFGVVFGLIFLGLEIRQNTVQLRAQASYAINEGLEMINSGVYSNEDLAAIILKGEEDFNVLSPIERRRFVAWEFSRINLAIHINKLEEEGVSNVHFNYVDFLIQEYETKPGLRQFARSISGGEWHGSEELYKKLSGINLK